MSALFDQLSVFDAAAWRDAIATLSPSIHEIDRTATPIWFAFYPLDLHLALERAQHEGDPAAAARRLRLMGRWQLSEMIDSSHTFLYAHRYWPSVKSAAATLNAGADARSLPALITKVAEAASRTARVDRELLLGMAAVALMTLRQVGPAAFAAAPGRIHLPPEIRRLTPHQVMHARARDDWQGVLGFLRGLKKRWTVTFDESDPSAQFQAIHGQEIASAAQSDPRDYRSRDPRCTPGEGPIPVECRAASCGTCWVGVLAGAEKLSAVEREERRRMAIFGYLDSDEPRPLVRLACQAKAHGAVSIVLPPWNGFIGKDVSGQKA